MYYKKYNARNLINFQTKIHQVTNESKTMCDACYSEIRPAPPMSLSPITRYAYLRGGRAIKYFKELRVQCPILALGSMTTRTSDPCLLRYQG